MATIDGIRNLEAELERQRKVLAASLRAERQKRKLSLRTVAQSVRLVPSALLKIESGRQWRTDTIARIVKYYARTDSKTTSPAPTPS